MDIDFSEITLDNNIRIVLSEFSTTNAVAANFIFGVGSRYEDDEFAGASHLFEHMLFKGTKKRPSPKQISSVMLIQTKRSQVIGLIFLKKTH